MRTNPKTSLHKTLLKSRFHASILEAAGHGRRRKAGLGGESGVGLGPVWMRQFAVLGKVGGGVLIGVVGT